MSAGSRSPRTFVFERLWRVRAPADEVFEALHDIDRYPDWWPQVREVTRHTDRTGSARIRSVLPYTLDVSLSEDLADPGTGRLRVGLAGDLVGFADFTVRAAGDGWTQAAFLEEVRLGVGWLASVDRILGPVMRANHEVMMRAGERGLQRFLVTKS